MKTNDIVIDLECGDDDERIVDVIANICNEFVSRHPNIDIRSAGGFTELLKDIQRKYKVPHEDITQLNLLWDIFTRLCYIAETKPTLQRFGIMAGIHPSTITNWITERYRVSSDHLESAQKWKNECESALYDQVITNGNIGCMFALKSNYGYREGEPQPTPRPREIEVSREEIQARIEMWKDGPQSVDDLPD